MLSRHTLAIALIFIPYVGLMGGLLLYMACQVRDRGAEPDEDLADLDVRDDEPGPMLMAA